MAESKLLPLSDVCAPMAVLVSERGWSLVQSNGSLGYHTQASVEKDGVVILHSNSKGEQDFGVRLTRAVHPTLSGELYRHPGLIEVLAAIGIQSNSSNVVFEAAENLSAIRNYLSDTLIWEENIRATTAELLDRYKTWSVGPDFMLDLANSLADRHPWLMAGKEPKITDLLNGEQLSSYKERSSHRGIVMGAVGVGMVIAHYWM